MRSKFCLAVLLVGILQIHLAQAAEDMKADVLILTTGGTIASPNDAPRIAGPVLVQAIPELTDHANIDVQEFSLIGSSKMTPTHWVELAQTVNRRLAEKPGLSGIVITHGTDTMEETATDPVIGPARAETIQ